jgi:plastocyanin
VELRAEGPLNHLRTLVLAGCCAFFAGCGGSPSSPSQADATVMLTATGLQPAEVRIPAGGQVVFVNNDVRPHAMSSDPITVHTDCPAINDVGTLAPGQSRSTGALTAVRTCGFHDHLNEFDNSWKGRIIVQ